jgi:hypothetical protein
VPPFYLRRPIIVVLNSYLVRHIITKPPFYFGRRIIVMPSYHILTSASSPHCHILSRPAQSVTTPYFFCAHKNPRIIIEQRQHFFAVSKFILKSRIIIYLRQHPFVASKFISSVLSIVCQIGIRTRPLRLRQNRITASR